jgi:hypothetical protein
MDPKTQRQWFKGILERHSVGVSVPDGFGPRSEHLTDVPDPNARALVEIPETIVMEEYIPEPVPPIEELTTSYYVQDVRCLLEANLERRQAENNPGTESSDEDGDDDDGEDEDEVATSDLPDDDLDELIRKGMPGEMRFGPAAAFRNNSDFQKHRQHLAGEYKRLSADLGLSDPIDICSVESCVANAAPGSKFCFIHSGLDPDFEKQVLFSRCHHAEGGVRCCVPCDRTARFCTLHDWRHDQPTTA